LRRLRDRYVDVLSEHQRVLRAAFNAYDGREVHTEGDAFFVAFARATDAVAAAVAGQRALASEPWPDGADVRVRMGVHTGEAAVSGGDYVGLDVHRAARICSAAHGGQTLLSSSTRELVADELAWGVALRDLGEHRLKDLDRPEHLFQLVVDDLPVDFPPLRSVSSGSPAARGLPLSPNRTVGREDDVRAISQRLRSGKVRLLTLTGPGGVGKTRLGLEAARAVEDEFGDGVCFVSLAALRRPEEIPSALVQRLAIVPLGGETAEQASMRFLSGKNLLLVLDNLEHLLPDGRFVAALVSACPRLTVVATSREPLALTGEERYPVAPLALPPDEADADALARAPAVALFAERALAHDPGFGLSLDNVAAVMEICRRMDGLPLAIELVAARCAVLSPAEIVARLDAALALLGRGPRDAPVRQQTLRATIDWSHDLLSDAEKACFARFAVFASGATADAAESITGADLDVLYGLLAKSLLARRRLPDRGERLLMLETIRAYADERFAVATDVEAVRERHCRYYLAVAQRHGTEQALWGAEQRDHLAVLDAETDNFDEAVRWAIGQRNAALALALVRWLAPYWELRHRFTHAVHSIHQALRTPDAEDYPELRAHALLASVPCLWPLGRRSEQPAAIDEATAIANELGDPALIARVFRWRSRREGNDGHLDLANALANDALRWAAMAGDDWEIALAASAKAMAARTLPELRALIAQATAQLSAVGNITELASLLGSAAYNALWQGGDRDAKELLERAEELLLTVGDPAMLMIARGNLGLAAVFSGDARTARRAFREELELCHTLAFRPVA
jgi:predicted ATPase